ncbi:hypothetical protein DCC81_09910 [Chitinophaga parva]|uniref:Uncharacterized protein n=1 Tax=Chitinophaga parva TaxID=2169414 RepID=A0A2T7BPZ2_9BACT|nr:hypothetical protein DCC81_09910 [Chitinophaga parva]
MAVINAPMQATQMPAIQSIDNEPDKKNSNVVTAAYRGGGGRIVTFRECQKFPVNAGWNMYL